MKAKIKNPLLLLLAVVIFAAAGCKKDETAPAITLVGGDTEIPLHGTYTEQGATAADDKDGDLSAQIVIVPNIDPNTLGTYAVNYSVTDEAGNSATKTRRVDVVMESENYEGTYATSSDCAFPLSIGDTQTITANGNEITINPVYGSLGGTLMGIVSGQSVTFSSQTVGTNTVIGTGSMSDDANTLVCNLTFSIPIVGDQVCALTYVRN